MRRIGFLTSAHCAENRLAIPENHATSNFSTFAAASSCIDGKTCE